MIFTFNIWVVLYTCGFAMGMFMVFLFFLSRKKYPLHIHNITLVLLTMSMLLLFEIAEESNLVDNYPFLLGIAPIIDMLIWPFLVFYVQYIIGKRNRYDWSTILYFMPFILCFIWQIPFLMLSAESKLAYFSEGIPVNVFLLVTFKLLCTSVFLLYILNLLSLANNNFKSIFPHNKKVEFLSKTRQFIIAISLVIILIYSMFYIQYFDLISIGDSDRIGGLIISFFIYLLGAMVFKNPQLFLQEKYSKQIIDFFNGTESKYIGTLLSLFNEKKIYLNEKLTVSEVAKEIGITNQQLSYLVNRQLGISFLDFINTYRVKEVIASIQKGDHQSNTLLGLALDAGFNSKASFNRIFKNHTGLSPSGYVKKLKEVSNHN